MEKLILRPYQEIARDVLIDKRRLLYADDMGLGKTPTSLQAMQDLGVERGLIFGTKVAMGTWEYHQKRWFGEDSIMYGGTPAQRRKQMEVFQKGNHRFLITNYALAEELQQYKWDALLCDEIHTDWVGLLNYTTDTFKEISKIARRVSVLDLITGTPVRKHLGNLWPSLHMIDPDRFSSYWSFVYSYGWVFKDQFGTHIEKKPKHPLEFRDMLRNYMIRRMKRNVLKELPGKSRIPLFVEMTKGQAKLYAQLTREMLLEIGDNVIATPSVGTQILRQRQLLITPQILGADELGGILEALPELIENEFAAGLPAVIFTPFKQAVPFIEAVCKKFATVYKIHGDMPGGAATKQALLFQNHPTPNRVLICTIKSGASFDAFAASACFFVGYEWSAANNKQAEDRLDRMGQQNAVRCYYFIYKGTTDELLLDTLDERTAAANWILRPEAVLTALKKI